MHLIMNKTLLALSLAAVLSACSKPPAAEEPVRAVKVMTVGVDSMTTGNEFAGEIRARLESRLGFRVGGKLIERPAEVGQRVQAGQVLARLDAQDYQLGLEAARAQQAAALTQRDLAAADFKRFKDLREQNFISSAELDRREAGLKAAQAQLDQAQAQAAVQGNQARYTTLVADRAGVVTAVEAEVGQVVSAGTPVLRLASDGARDVVFAVPEDRLAMVRMGLPVKLRLWSERQELDGKVREVAASADPVTRTYQVKIAIEDKQAMPPLGATVTVVAQTAAAASAAPAVIKLPTSALRQEGQGSAVWVLDTATMSVRSQPVQVATADGNEAVISAGLAPGMQVVSAGVHVLSPGQKVTLYKAPATAQAGSAGNAPAAAALPVVANTSK
jgi:multidrug efflux system membrane fusion protein